MRPGTCPLRHYLESWGDARSGDGTMMAIQPLIEPLFGGRTVAGACRPTGQVRDDPAPAKSSSRAFRKVSGVGEAGFEAAWRKISP